MTWIAAAAALALITGRATSAIVKHQRINIMYKKSLSALIMFVLLGVIPLLSACQTTAGAGRDTSGTGHAITDSAERHAP